MIEQLLNELVGDGFCIRPKVVLTNDEVGWFATYYPDVPQLTNSLVVLGDTPVEALSKLVKALGVKEG